MLALPDSGTDISAARSQLLKQLSEHTLNLLCSEVTLKTANGHKIQPLGKLPLTFQCHGRDHSEDTHIYPRVSGVTVSWKTAKGLNILPEHYRDPVAITHTTVEPAGPKVVEVNGVNNEADTPTESKMINMYPYSLWWHDKSHGRKSSMSLSLQMPIHFVCTHHG